MSEAEGDNQWSTVIIKGEGGQHTLLRGSGSGLHPVPYIPVSNFLVGLVLNPILLEVGIVQVLFQSSSE